MGTVSIPANELNALLENISLYTDKKSIHLREVLFIVGNGFIQLFACDEYVAITDQIKIPDLKENKEFALSIKDVEGFLAWVKEDKKTVHKTILKLKFKNTLFTGESEDYDSEFKAEYIKPAWDRWNVVLDLLSEEHDPVDIPTYCVNPERFAKLARIKSEKEAPVAFRAIDPHGKMVLQFKKGSVVKGVVMPVDEEYVEDDFLWKNQGDTEVSPNSTSTESVENSID